MDNPFLIPEKYIVWLYPRKSFCNMDEENKKLTEDYIISESGFVNDYEYRGFFSEKIRKQPYKKILNEYQYYLIVDLNFIECQNYERYILNQNVICNNFNARIYKYDDFKNKKTFAKIVASRLTENV